MGAGRLFFQVWFGGVLAFWLIIAFILVQAAFAVSVCTGRSKKQAETWYIVIANYCFWMMFVCTPWVSVKGAKVRRSV
jgi:hypothetical protein